MISANLPTRLHHNAYVTADMEAARHFCEDLIGLPLVATWCEADELFGKERVYCHCFFGLADDSALAFFSVRPLGRPEPVRTENVVLAIPSHRVKLRCSHAKRGTEVLVAAGYREPNLYVLELLQVPLRGRSQRHDLLELTVDNPKAASGVSARRASTHADLKRWLSGDHSSNNTWRQELHQPA